VISSIRGAANPQVEITSGVAELTVRPDRSALAGTASMCPTSSMQSRPRDPAGLSRTSSRGKRNIRSLLVCAPGYFIEYGGQFENQQHATRRLMFVIPLAIAIIFGLLYTTFGSASQAFLILMDVPFALVGGIAALWLRHMNLNLQRLSVSSLCSVSPS